MLVTIKYRLFSIFISSILIITIPSVSALLTTSSTNNYLEQVQANYDSNYSQRNLWSLGNSLQEGDYYSYKICNDDTMYQKIYPYHCYVISLEFVKLMESYTGDMWIVQSYLTVGDGTNYSIYNNIDDSNYNSNTSPLILLIDPYTFHVTTDPFNRIVGESIQNTIFSLSIHGEQSLSIGTIWDEMDSYYTNKIPLEIKNKQTIQVPELVQSQSLNGTVVSSIVTSIEASVLSYDIIVPSNTYIHPDFPFPVQAKLYSPNIIYPIPQELYYYELLEYRVNRVIETIVETIPENIVETIPENIVETIVENIVETIPEGLEVK